MGVAAEKRHFRGWRREPRPRKRSVRGNRRDKVEPRGRRRGRVREKRAYVQIVATKSFYAVISTEEFRPTRPAPRPCPRKTRVRADRRDKVVLRGHTYREKRAYVQIVRTNLTYMRFSRTCPPATWKSNLSPFPGRPLFQVSGESSRTPRVSRPAGHPCHQWGCAGSAPADWLGRAAWRRNRRRTSRHCRSRSRRQAPRARR